MAEPGARPLTKARVALSPSAAATTTEGGVTLARALRDRLGGKSWQAVRNLCETGKVRVNGTLVLDSATRVEPDAELHVDMGAPRPRSAPIGFRVVFEDRHLIVIEKPAGVSSTPAERRETGTALDLVRDHWRSLHRPATDTPLYVVHRLDKETSGLLCLAKTRVGARGLHEVFQRHLAERSYLAVAHGRLDSRRIESHLVPDRGDGLRGSARHRSAPHATGAPAGQRAVTHVEVLEHLAAATTCRVTLETGRTHQIRIHLAEAGHPIVGDRVYVRDLLRAGARPLPSRRLMLHAATLGFAHPVTGERLSFASAMPADFAAGLTLLEPRGARRG